MNVKEVLGAFLLVNNPIVLSEEETKDVQKAIKQLQQENKQLKEQVQDLKEKIILLKASGPMIELEKYYGERDKYKEVIDKVSSQIKLYGKYNGEKCTRGFSMMSADFNKLLDILKEVE